VFKITKILLATIPAEMIGGYTIKLCSYPTIWKAFLVVVSKDTLSPLFKSTDIFLRQFYYNLLRKLIFVIMKKFNTKILIIGLLILLGLIAAVVTTFGQQWMNPKDLNPPTDLFATVEDENDVNLFWTEPSSGTSTYLHWDSGENADSFGNFLGPATFLFAAKFDPAHITAYDGWTITQMRFWVTSPMPTIQLKIWTGPDATEVYSQDVPVFNVNDWTEIEFDTPITIDASTELWAGLYVDMPVPGPVMGGDEGPAIDGYGNMYNYAGTWYSDFDMNWNIQIQVEEPELPTYLHWDSGENSDSWGFMLGGAQFDVAAKWNPEHIANYDGWEITSLRFFVTNPNPTLQLKIWTGPDATEVYSQDVTTFNINDWTEITLDNPVTIDASTELWAGLYIDMPVGAAVMGTDDGPAVTGLGNLYNYAGTWYSDGSKNWNIQIQVDGSKSGPKDFLGYNVYRDDIVINIDPVTSTAYVDENLLNGTYNYHVTAVYVEGESDPSNTVEVIIDQPVILYADSMALVDLYNNCNGPNWTNNDLWLAGPVEEWDGISTTGTRVTYVFLANNNLTGNIPESFGDLTALENLHIESNEITSLPESIGNLQALTEFWVGWTSITSVPESLGNLSSLEQLHLGFTDLGTLPESFSNLENLDWLALGDAGLNSLPESFGNLTAVTSCFLWGNSLTELPDNIGGMESLRFLSLDDNQLTTLPESICDLNNLGWLYINQNQLTSLPENIGNLSTLDTLLLSENQLTYLPESVGNLDDLNYLNVDYNNLTEFPASISDLATIEYLRAFENQLTSLPEDIGNLGNSLMALVLSYNNITSLPESMSELINLWEFYAPSNQIENIPVNVGNMANLHTLGLNNNNIETVPESIGNLNLLGYIALSDNDIDELPESFGNLNADTVLLSNNNIPELPSGMFDKYFDFLWVENNNLQFGSLEPFMDNGIWEFIYDPQAQIGNDTTIEVINNGILSYTIEVSGDNNVYQWYKDGTLLFDQTSNTLYVENASIDDQGTYMLKVTNTLVPVLELSSYDVEVSIITGISETQEAILALFPNPASGNEIMLISENSEEIIEVTIMSLSGQVLITESTIKSSGKLDISELNKGMYLVQVILQDSQTIIKKLIVD